MRERLTERTHACVEFALELDLVVQTEGGE